MNRTDTLVHHWVWSPSKRLPLVITAKNVGWAIILGCPIHGQDQFKDIHHPTLQAVVERVVVT
jgi:hypothetical protein